MDFERFVIDALKEITENQKEVKSVQNETLVQTTKTNGRVDKLEDWKSFFNKIIWAIVAYLFTILGFLVQNYISKH